jgi:ribonuclease D
LQLHPHIGDSQLPAAMKELRRRNVLAVDCEGVNMDRRGRLCVVSIATAKTRFVFDVVALGAQLFDAGLRCAQLQSYFHEHSFILFTRKQNYRGRSCSHMFCVYVG